MSQQQTAVKVKNILFQLAAFSETLSLKLDFIILYT